MCAQRSVYETGAIGCATYSSVEFNGRGTCSTDTPRWDIAIKLQPMNKTPKSVSAMMTVMVILNRRKGGCRLPTARRGAQRTFEVYVNAPPPPSDVTQTMHRAQGTGR